MQEGLRPGLDMESSVNCTADDGLLYSDPPLGQGLSRPSPRFAVPGILCTGVKPPTKKGVSTHA